MSKKPTTRNFFSHADNYKKKPVRTLNSLGVRNTSNGTIHYMKDYYKDLERFVKKSNWSAFGTMTFERRYKTPKMIYDHKVLKDFIPDVDKPFYEFPTWEPTEDSVKRYMFYLEKLLTQYSWKKWTIFWVIENHKDGTPHVHCMIKNSRWGKGDIALLSNLWRFLRGGYIKIDEFQKKKGTPVTKSINYCFKYVTKDNRNCWDWLRTDPDNFRLKNEIKTYFQPEQINKIKSRNMDLIEKGSKKERVELKVVHRSAKKVKQVPNLYKSEMYVI